MNKIFLLLSLSTTIAFSQTPAGQAPAKSDFLSLCKATFSQNAEKLPMCNEIHQKFFSKSSGDIASILPSDVKAKPSSIDGKVEFLVFNDPNYLPAIAYC